jgi:hypothetical protein
MPDGGRLSVSITAIVTDSDPAHCGYPSFSGCYRTLRRKSG